MKVTNYHAELVIEDRTGDVISYHATFNDEPSCGVHWHSWGCEVDIDTDGDPTGVTIREPVEKWRLRLLMEQFGQDGKFVMNTVPYGLIVDQIMCEQSKGLGPCNTSKCPKCGNSLQNCHPAMSVANLLICASCKTLFLRAEDDEFIYEGQPVPADRAAGSEV